VTSPSFKPATFNGLGNGTLTLYDISGGVVTTSWLSTWGAAFTARTGIKVRSDFHGDSSALFAGIQAHSAPWDVAMFDGGPAAQAVKNGDLLPLDTKVIPTNLLNSGSTSKYVFSPIINAVLLTWNLDKFPAGGPQPDTIAKFFDTKKFPGKRCLFKSPQGGGVLEAGSAAAGIPANKTYPLNTTAAFRELDRIKNDTVWFTSADQAQRSLANGNCAMGILWANRIYSDIHANGAHLGYSWNFAVGDRVNYAVPKTSPNPKAAQAFLAMMIYDRAGETQFAKQVGIAPDYKKPLDLPSDLKALIASKSNLKNAIMTDDAWYGKNLTSLTNKFDAWLVK